VWQFVYILRNEIGNQYIGQTDNLERRLHQHNLGHVSATTGGRPWQIAWFCGFRTKSEAAIFEKYLKGGSGTMFRFRHLVQKK